MLAYTHDPLLVFASLCVVLISGFTGLSLTNGLATRPINERKVAVAMSAVALGGGIWAMHFIAMLGLKLPILFYYDLVLTLISALVAILVVGVALLILHFFKRSVQSIMISGVIVGSGVVLMHYIGMEGLRLCKATYSALDLGMVLLLSCVLNAMAFYIAYGHRSQRNILLGTLVFGLAVFSVHFFAILRTKFHQIAAAVNSGPLVSNESIALGVIIISFLLCGAFLLNGVTFINPSKGGPAQPDRADQSRHSETESQGFVQQATVSRQGLVKSMNSQSPVKPSKIQIPYEKGKQTFFIEPEDVFAIRADGHYTVLYSLDGAFLCPWSFTEAERKLSPAFFTKTHRSFLINLKRVKGFERTRDNGLCLFDLPALANAPVSRSHLKSVQTALGL